MKNDDDDLQNVEENAQVTSTETDCESPSAEGDTASGAGDGKAIQSATERPRLDPTRYGDWEKNGRCIDF